MILKFSKGLVGFTDVREYVLSERFESGLRMLRAKGGEPEFVVVDPSEYAKSYHPVFSDVVRKELDREASDTLRLVVLVTVHSGIMTLNLESPIVYNPSNGYATQFIIPNDKYPLRYVVAPITPRELRHCG